jgi:hypothetical protein
MYYLFNPLLHVYKMDHPFFLHILFIYILATYVKS